MNGKVHATANIKNVVIRTETQDIETLFFHGRSAWCSTESMKGGLKMSKIIILKIDVNPRIV